MVTRNVGSYQPSPGHFGLVYEETGDGEVGANKYRRVHNTFISNCVIEEVAKGYTIDGGTSRGKVPYFRSHFCLIF